MPNRRGTQTSAVSRETTTRMVAAVTLSVVLGGIGFLAAGSVARSANRTNASVSLRTSALGRILVNSRSHTIYLFAKDRNAKSACTGSCASFWPPLLSKGKPTGGPGVKKSLLGTTTRSDGRRQVTYNKHPLYTYTLDTRAGQTKGEGISAFGAKWYAVSAKGTAVIKAPGTTTTTSTYTTTTTPYP